MAQWLMRINFRLSDPRASASWFLGKTLCLCLLWVLVNVLCNLTKCWGRGGDYLPWISMPSRGE